MFKLIDLAFSIVETGLLIYILSSWILHPISIRIRTRLAPLYEPLLAPIRRWIIAPCFGRLTIDLSPLVLLIALGILRQIVLTIFW
jgi:uncharacterized protein YggT (Ycf19 family)